MKEKCRLCGCELTEEDLEKFCAIGTIENEIEINTPICPACLLNKTVLSKIIPEKKREQLLNKWRKHRLAELQK